MRCACALCWGLSTVAGRAVMVEMSLPLAAGLRVIIGLVCMTILVGARGLLTADALWPAAAQAHAAKTVTWLVLLATLSGGIPLLIYFKGLELTRASTAGYFEMMQTLAAVIITWGFFGAALAWWQVIAALVLMFAVAMVQRAQESTALPPPGRYRQCPKRASSSAGPCASNTRPAATLEQRLDLCAGRAGRGGLPAHCLDLGEVLEAHRTVAILRQCLLGSCGVGVGQRELGVHDRCECSHDRITGMRGRDRIERPGGTISCSIACTGFRPGEQRDRHRPEVGMLGKPGLGNALERELGEERSHRDSARAQSAGRPRASVP